MVQQALPTIAGVAVSWANVQLTTDIINGPLVKVVDFASIDFGVKIEIGEQKGATGGRVMRHTSGEEKLDDAKITFYRSGLRDLKRKMMQSPFAIRRGKQVVIGFVPLNLRCAYTPIEEPSEIYIHILKGCRINMESLKSAEGSDPSKVDVGMKPKGLVEIIDGLEVSYL